MKEYAPKSTNEAFWLRDASNIENSQALLLIGLSKPVTAGYDCGACGYPTCDEFSKNKQMKAKEMGYTGPHCVMRMMDIGVALVVGGKDREHPQRRQPGAAARRRRSPGAGIHPGRGRHGHPHQHRRQEHLLRPAGARSTNKQF